MMENERGSTIPTTVSVVIPTRDRPSSLRRSVASALAQRSVDVTVVVVDDASKVPARKALRETDARVTSLRNDPARGPARARNQGAVATDSDLIAFLDDDDRWLPQKLVRCLEALARHPEAGLVAHAASFSDPPEAGPARLLRLEDPVRRMLTRQPPHLSGVVVRREVHEQVRFDESFPAAEDLDYLLRIAEVAPVVELDAVLTVLGRTGNSSMIGYQQRIDGRRRFHAKHRELFGRGAEAFHQLRLGHLHRRAGHRGHAAAAFARALRSRPTSVSAWKGLLSTTLPAALVERIAFRHAV